MCIILATTSFININYMRFIENYWTCVCYIESDDLLRTDTTVNPLECSAAKPLFAEHLIPNIPLKMEHEYLENQASESAEMDVYNIKTEKIDIKEELPDRVDPETDESCEEVQNDISAINKVSKHDNCDIKMEEIVIKDEYMNTTDPEKETTYTPEEIQGNNLNNINNYTKIFDIGKRYNFLTDFSVH